MRELRVNWEELKSRDEWFELRLQKGRHGGWDIMLRLDGAYFDKDEARRIMEYSSERLGIPAGERRDV